MINDVGHPAGGDPDVEPAILTGTPDIDQPVGLRVVGHLLLLIIPVEPAGMDYGG
jgi:hypothetical protein